MSVNGRRSPALGAGLRGCSGSEGRRPLSNCYQNALTVARRGSVVNPLDTAGAAWFTRVSGSTATRSTNLRIRWLPIAVGSPTSSCALLRAKSDNSSHCSIASTPRQGSCDRPCSLRSGRTSASKFDTSPVHEHLRYDVRRGGADDLALRHCRPCTAARSWNHGGSPGPQGTRLRTMALRLLYSNIRQAARRQRT